jgi:hypothetical protein
MARRRYSTRRSFRRSSRPSERIIRGSTVIADSSATTDAFVYTADVPQTVTRFKLDIGIAGVTTGNSPSDFALPLVYALIHVPEGYPANPLTYPAITTDLYNPTTNVLISGVVTDPTLEDHKSSSYGRKLKTGDRIALIIRYPANITPLSIATSFELSFTSVR